MNNSGGSKSPSISTDGITAFTSGFPFDKNNTNSAEDVYCRCL